MTISTLPTRGRRFQAALPLDPIPASKVQSGPLQFAELDRHNSPDSPGSREVRLSPDRAGSVRLRLRDLLRKIPHEPSRSKPGFLEPAPAQATCLILIAMLGCLYLRWNPLPR
jgi:hypothetical protein